MTANKPKDPSRDPSREDQTTKPGQRPGTGREDKESNPNRQTPPKQRQ